MLWYLVYRIGAFLARNLPQRWGVAIARWVGRVIYRFSPVAENNRDNVRHVLNPNADPDRVDRLARKAFESRVLNYYDMLKLSGVPLAQVSSRTSIEGLEIALQLLEEKRGAVVASAHIGPMEYMIQAIAAYGFPLIGITEHLRSERLHRYLMDLRSAHGLDLISTQGSLLDIFRRIKRGDVLASAADRDSTGTGLVVDFFGAPAWMPDGYARVAVRMGVPVIFGYCIRTENGAKGRIFPLIYPDTSLGKEEAVRDVIQRTLRLLEEAIRENPGEWHLSTPIWRRAQERLEEGSSP
jgi:lauroyl/myristoyl acyltransferase